MNNLSALIIKENAKENYEIFINVVTNKIFSITTKIYIWSRNRDISIIAELQITILQKGNRFKKFQVRLAPIPFTNSHVFVYTKISLHINI